MNSKKKGFTLVFVVLTLAVIMGVFLRFAWKVRTRKVKIQTEIQADDYRKSQEETVASSIVESYLINEMIRNPLDAKGFGNHVNSPVDYFIVKDKEYKKSISGTTITFTDLKQYIWEIGNSDNNDFWESSGVWKTADGSKPGRFSKGGYYITSIQFNGENLSLSGNSIQEKLVGNSSEKEFIVNLKKDIMYKVGSTIKSEFESEVKIKLTYGSENSNKPEKSELLEYQITHKGP